MSATECIVLFLTRNWSDKAVFIAAVIFLLQPVEWYHYIAALINPAHQLPDLKVRFYGKMSLTNYVSQSIMGALIYFPIGLYLAPYCGYTISLFIGILMFILQAKFSRWWLSRHKQGPLEYIWHKCTWIGKSK